MKSLTGFSSNYVMRALNGHFTPSLDRFRVVARALGKTVHELAVELQIAEPAPPLPRQGFYNKIEPGDVNRSLVSRKTGLSISYISRILNQDPGQHRQPRVVDLWILSKHFRCSIDHLIKCWKL